MPNPQRGGEPLTISGGPLGDLAFEWADDRYTHRWQIGTEQPICLVSTESDGQVVWPLSPPLQQIHQQQFGDGRDVVFGVGMAGRGHWSASFTLVPDLNCWIVELACRASQPPENLGSTYQVDADWSQVSEQTLSRQAGSQRVELEAIAPGAHATLNERTARIIPSLTRSGAVTTQWTFRIRVLAS